jgi:tetratricopeptide (TPR) repeat protein
VESIDPLRELSGLVDQSLIDEHPEAGAADEPRFRMLETIREFAIEQLTGTDESAEVERAFELFLINLTELAESGLRGPDQLDWLDRLEDEHDNFRAAIGRMLDREDGEAALNLAPRLWEFWRLRGHPVEGRGWLERAITLSTTAAPALHAAAAFAIGKLSIDLGDYDAASRNFQKSIELWQSLENRAALIDAKNALMIVKLNVGLFEEARALGEEALRISREIGDTRGTAIALLNLGMLEREGDHLTTAIELLNESLILWRQLGDPTFIALTTMNLGQAYRFAGDPDRAEALLSESSDLYEEIGDRFNLGVISHDRGHLEREAGNLDRAAEHYVEAMRLFEDVPAPEGIVESIEWIAVNLVAAKDMLPALRLLGSATAARQVLHLPPLAQDALLIERNTDLATKAVDPELAQQAWETGAALSFDEAREAALELASSTRRKAHGGT